MPRSTATTQLFCTTSSAMAGLGTYWRATRNISGVQRCTSIR
jgi:hypothetical protein